MVEAICEKSLSKWLKEIPQYFNAKTRIEASSEEEKQRIVERVRLETQNRTNRTSQRSMVHGKEEPFHRKLETIQIDGVRADFPDGWIICRGSGTEDAVRLFAEAKTEKRAKELLEEWKKIAEG
jgi:phosphomannomutase/phosphoglucomutase